MQVSRNGRYALFVPGLPSASSLVDFSAPDSAVEFYQWPRHRQALTNTGTVVPGQGTLLLQDGLRTRSLTTSVPAGAAAVSAAGNVAIYELSASRPAPRQLYAINLATGNLFHDARGGLRPPQFNTRSEFEAVINDTGTTVLALPIDVPGTPRQWLFTTGTDGSKPTWFGFDAEGYAEATLSADGRIAFAATESGRLIRADLTTGDITELLPPTPQVHEVLGAVRPASAIRTRGRGFAEETATTPNVPAEEMLASVRVKVNGERDTPPAGESQ